MKLSKLFGENKLSLSFEVFPPKTDTLFESVKHATEEIAKLKPSFMSVTYGAGGGTSRYTLDIAKNIKESYGVPTLAHLTCVSSTKETLKTKIEEIKAAGIENIMAL
ncbi:MAG: methylenetetrahydrofolate reductase, partial [Clostridia bacterium]|nr:methylenetetrahydrofolate reductase [Clostridia bacterium]